MATQALSNVRGPDGNILGAAAPGGGTPSGDGRLFIADLLKPMKGYWPAPDAVNGPILSDTGMVAGTPSPTGVTLYPFNSGVFNTQSQNWVTMPVGTWQNNSGFPACANATTPRFTTWDVNEGLPQESNLDTGFVSDSPVVTIVYMHYVHYETRQYHDMQLWAEDDTGAMKKITQLPKTGSTANGIAYRTITFKEAREREFRLMLPWNCHFIGIYVGNLYTVRKSPNKLLIATNGDSWNEPSGNVLQTPIGGGWPTGTYQTYGLSQAIAEATGAAVILTAQGGTGYFNVNNAARNEEYVMSLGGGSVFMSKSRMDFLAETFGDRYPLLWTIGGWNDGSLPPDPVRTTYAARVTSGINRAVAAVAAATANAVNLQLLFSGIQSVSITNGDDRYLANLGIQDAVASADPDNVIGFIDQIGMWPNTTMSGHRGNNVGPDTLHLHAKGADMVANWNLAAAKTKSIPADYYAGMLNWEAA